MNPVKIAAHLHIYYENLWDELKDCLESMQSNNVKCDVFVTMGQNKELEQKILEFDSNAQIFFLENRGCDIGPFFYVLNKLDLSEYDYIVKLHTKRDCSFFIGCNGLLRLNWRKHLLDFCKTSENFKQTLSILNKSSNLGMLISGKLIMRRRDEYVLYRDGWDKASAFLSKIFAKNAGGGGVYQSII